MRHLPLVLAATVWLVLLGTLAVRQIPPRGIDPTTLPAAERETAPARREEWFGLYAGGRKLGHVRRTSEAMPGGLRFEDHASLEVALLGVPQRIETRFRAEVNEALALQRFVFSLRASGTRLTARGEQRPDGLAVRLETDGGVDTVTVPLSEPLRLSGALRPRIAAAWPSPGTRFRHDVLDPLTLRRQTLVTEVEAVEGRDGIETLRLRESQQGMEARVWVDSTGRVLREESALGLVLLAESPEAARGGRDRIAAVDLALALRIPLAGRIPGDPRTLERLRLRLTGAAGDRVPSAPPRQRVRGGVLEIVREPWPPHPRVATVPDPRLREPEPFLESDDPLVVRRARAAVGDARDDVERTQRLVAWLHERMRPEPVATVPSARAVARTLRGDCNEYAVLLAAMARAVGIPARVVAGAMYVDGAFAYHAWNELWIGDWVAVDATLGQVPADATHVKLVEGGPAAHVELATVLGRLGFETVEEDG